MKSKISFRAEDGILSCFITGERSDDEALDYWQELINECHHQDISRLQLTIALRGKYSPFDAIKNYQSIISMLKPSGIIVAVLDLNHLSAPDSQVACNMAASQGLNVAYFGLEKDAKAWLLAKTPETRTIYSPQENNSVTVMNKSA